MWPGGDHFWEYKTAKDRASAVGFRVRYWLKRFKELNIHVDVMTHSMGGRVILCALQNSTEVLVNYVYTLAAAVDNESIEFEKKYYEATQRSNRFYVFHSINDPVLEAGYPLFHWDKALGFNGPEHKVKIKKHSPRVKVINCSQLIHEHGDYKSCDAVYQYINAELLNPSAHKQFFILH